MTSPIVLSILLTSLAVFLLPGYLLWQFHRMRMEGVGIAFRVCLMIWALWIGYVALIWMSIPDRWVLAPDPEPVAVTTGAVAEGGGFGGKREQNKRNRRTKRINRKNGIGMLPVVKWEEVNHV